MIMNTVIRSASYRSMVTNKSRIHVTMRYFNLNLSVFFENFDPPFNIIIFRQFPVSLTHPTGTMKFLILVQISRIGYKV
jgi:hypothetical protein